MRCLIIPRFEFTDGRGSLTIQPLTFMADVMEVDSTATFIVVIPSHLGGMEWFRNYGWGRELIDRVEPLYVDIEGSTRSRRLGFTMGAKLFNSLTPNKIPFCDVVVSEIFPSHPILRTALAGTFSRSKVAKIPLVGRWEWHFAEVSDSNCYNEFDPMAEAFGAVVCTHLIVSPGEPYRELTGWFRKYFNGSVVSNLLMRMTQISTGVRVSEIPRKEIKSVDKPVGMWSGYWQQDFKECASALLDCLKMGRLSKVILQFCSWPWETAQITEEVAKEELKKYGEISGVEIHGPKPHGEYIKMLHEADLFVSTTPGSYGLRLCEMISAGVLPIVPKSIADILLPASYPFVADKEPMLTIAAACKMLKEHPDFMVRSKSLSWFETHHDSTENSLKVWKRLGMIVEEQRHKTNFGEMGEIARETAKLVKDDVRLTHIEAMKIMSARTRSKMDLVSNALFTPNFLRWALIDAGLQDIGDKDSPVYVKD